jgi:phenylalanine-4-hydroxylase
MADGIPPKHGLLSGAAAHRADWMIDQDWERYGPADHAVWKTLFERQAGLLPGRACAEFLGRLSRRPARRLIVGAQSPPAEGPG